MFSEPESTPSYPADAVVVANNIDRVVVAIDEDSLLAVWAISRLAALLGVTVTISSSTDPVEIVGEIGADWADLVVQMNREHPDRAHEILRAAHGAFERIRRGAQPTS